MLAPMRPRPTIPSCIYAPLSFLLVAREGCEARHHASLLLQSLFYQFGQFCEPRFYIAAEVHTQSAALAVGKNLKISPRLCRLHHPESVLLSGNLQVLRIVAGNVQENAAVGSAFVGLSRRMQKAWTKTETRCHALAIAHEHAQGL